MYKYMYIHDNICEHIYDHLSEHPSEHFYEHTFTMARWRRGGHPTNAARRYSISAHKYQLYFRPLIPVIFPPANTNNNDRH